MFNNIFSSRKKTGDIITDFSGAILNQMKRNTIFITPNNK